MTWRHSRTGIRSPGQARCRGRRSSDAGPLSDPPQPSDVREMRNRAIGLTTFERRRPASGFGLSVAGLGGRAGMAHRVGIPDAAVEHGRR